MDNNSKIIISYEPQDIDTAKKLSLDLTEKGLQTNLIDYDDIKETAEIVNNYSMFLALLSKNTEKFSVLFNSLLAELENKFWNTDPSDYVIQILTKESSIDPNNNRLPAIPMTLSLADYDNCLLKILNKSHPIQLKDFDKKSVIHFQWDVTSGLFQLPEDIRITICRQYLGKNYDLNLPTTILCKNLLEYHQMKNTLDVLWETIQSYQPKNELVK